MCEFPCIRILSVDCACEQAARESQPRLSFSQFFLMGKKGPKSPIAKAMKGKRNASKQRSESEGLQEALPLRDERGASTSAAAPMHHARKTTPDRKKRLQ